MRNKEIREPFYPGEQADYWVVLTQYGPSAYLSFEELSFRINVPMKTLGSETVDIICTSREEFEALSRADLMDSRGFNSWDIRRMEAMFDNGPMVIRLFQSQLIDQVKKLIEDNISLETGRGGRSFGPADITAAVERRKPDWDPGVPWGEFALQVAQTYYWNSLTGYEPGSGNPGGH